MQPPRIHSRSFSLALAGAMASSNAKTVDIKLSFPQTDMVPGPLGLEFQRDATQRHQRVKVVGSPARTRDIRRCGLHA